MQESKKTKAIEDFEGKDTLDSASSESDEVYPLNPIRIEKGRMSLYEIKRQYEERR